MSRSSTIRSKPQCGPALKRRSNHQVGIILFFISQMKKFRQKTLVEFNNWTKVFFIILSINMATSLGLLNDQSNFGVDGGHVVLSTTETKWSAAKNGVAWRAKWHQRGVIIDLVHPLPVTTPPSLRASHAREGQNCAEPIHSKPFSITLPLRTQRPANRPENSLVN